MSIESQSPSVLLFCVKSILMRDNIPPCISLQMQHCFWYFLVYSRYIINFYTFLQIQKWILTLKWHQNKLFNGLFSEKVFYVFQTLVSYIFTCSLWCGKINPFCCPCFTPQPNFNYLVLCFFTVHNVRYIIKSLCFINVSI